MLETHTWTAKSKQFRILRLFEKLQGKHAKTLICCTQDMAEFVKNFHFTMKNQLVKPACVNLEQFSFSNRKNPYLMKKLGLEGKIVCVYAGKFGGLYLEQEVFDFFKVAYNYWGKNSVFCYSRMKRTTRSTIGQRMPVPRDIIYNRYVFHSKVADYMGLGDFGISPYNPVPSRKYSAPIKKCRVLGAWSSGGNNQQNNGWQ